MGWNVGIIPRQRLESFRKFLYNIYEIEDRKTTTYFIAEIQRIYTKDINNKLEQERKAQERKSKAGGKKYAHKVG